MATENRDLPAEQAYVDRLYSRLDELTETLQQRLDEAQASQSATTHQNRSERDAFVARYEDRLSLLASVRERVVFGRLDREDDSRLYIGRIGLFTPEREQLLVDWRAPAAAAFYQATSTERLGVTLRRHLITRGRTVLGLEDDVLDASLLDGSDADGASLQGEGALLAALSSQRTGRMGDIVSTIQAEQDRIIRADVRGVLVVQGGPGTGKTAVALHRAAYLLYTHRRKLEHAGVLIVAPTDGFLRYIERVLPSLGESGVAMLTPGQLLPGMVTDVHDSPEAQRVKGDLRMAKLLKRAVSQRQLRLEEPVQVAINSVVLTIEPKDVAAAQRDARSSHKPHNEARDIFVRIMLDKLADQYLERLRAAGHAVLEEDRATILGDLPLSREVRVTLNKLWLPYTPQMFLKILLAHPERLRAADRGLSERDIAAIVREKDSPFTVEDVPLLDELAELLGEDPAGASARSRAEREDLDAGREYAQQVIDSWDGAAATVDADTLAAQMRQGSRYVSLAERAAGDRTWAFGHVVVDEAQELSQMMWRLLMRRCPTKSFTVVGDVAQTSSPAGTRSWRDTFAPHVEERAVVEELTVNYRTPRLVMDAAQRVAAAAGVVTTPVTSVREGEHEIEYVSCAADEAAAEAVACALRQKQATGGRIAVICPSGDVAAIGAEFARAGVSAGLGSGGIDSEVAVMDAEAAKGLEFDAVTLVEPGAIAAAHSQGASDVFVAMTRPTAMLGVVYSGKLPEGL
ncbi:HelD family protein [Dermabacteraceae bacterium P13128]